MKNALSFCFFLLVGCFAATAQAPATAYTQSTFYTHLQNTNYWKGGHPGQPTEWNCAQNWSLSQVPNEFSNVVIPDVSTQTNAYPVLRNTDTEVNSLVLLSGASLTVASDASLSVVTSVEKVGNARLQVRGILVGETASKSGLAARK